MGRKGRDIWFPVRDLFKQASDRQKRGLQRLDTL